MQPIHFPGALGEPLAARLDLPAGEVIAYALFAHCFTCSKDSLAAARVSAELKAQGIAVLRFDFTGLGGSQGDFANTGFSSNVADVVAAAAYLRREHEAPRLLIGHSLGGAAVLAAAREIPEAAALVTIGAPAEPAHVARLLAPARAEIEARGEAEVELAGRRFRIRREFLDDLARANILKSLGNLRKALLVMHSPRDTVVDIENAARLFMAAKHPKSFVSLDEADHLITHREDAAYVARVLAAWASRYLGRGESRQETSPACPEGVVRVEEEGSGKYAQTICAGRHRLRADEPQSYGGTDTGPSPYQLLLASLGACTSMTLRMYADQKGWPLERVAVELKHEKIHAADCETCETKEGRVDRIERVIELEGALDEAQRGRLLEIANKCPVHRTLHSEVTIPTRLK
ncbi:bifunctional alpha/beta hydrolase/OsmC family protein [Pelomicrobium sp. G1]|uniref:bifunctional alpha/beta hydrolase/OsmC family protein n=1 Tax=unclassified Pelomicrobium TaxID=2815318 RepID=UPI00348A6B87